LTEAEEIQTAVILTKERAFAIVAMLLSVVVSFALCEVMVRFFAPSWLKQRMAILNPDSSTAGFGTDRNWKVEFRDGKFFSFTPYSRFDVSHVEYNNIANIDELGGRRVPFRSGPDLKLLPLLGDSFTFGVGVEDEETFASKLAAQLPAFRVLNLGVPLSGLNEEIDIIKLRHTDLNRPTHYIIFFFLGNDFQDIVSDARSISASQEKTSKSEKFSDKVFSALWVVNGFFYHNRLLKHSFLVQFFRKFALDLVNSISMARGLEPQESDIFLVMDKLMTNYQAEAQKAIEVQLNELKRLQQQLGFTSMIVAIPDVNQLDDARRQLSANGYGISLDRLEPFRPNHQLRNLVEAAGIAFCDPTECLAKTGLGGRLYYQQDIHFRAVGHDALARCLGPQLERFLTPSGE
jgi:hypothetical protein